MVASQLALDTVFKMQLLTLSLPVSVRWLPLGTVTEIALLIQSLSVSVRWFIEVEDQLSTIHFLSENITTLHLHFRL